jgi:hypothetical protein
MAAHSANFGFKNRRAGTAVGRLHLDGTRASLTPLYVSKKVTLPPATVYSKDDTCAVKVMTEPLDGFWGVVKRVVVVEEVAHAAGPAVTNARALNSTGIHRRKDPSLEFMRRVNATVGGCVMGLKAPVNGRRKA